MIIAVYNGLLNIKKIAIDAVMVNMVNAMEIMTAHRFNRIMLIERTLIAMPRGSPIDAKCCR